MLSKGVAVVEFSIPHKDILHCGQYSNLLHAGQSGVHIQVGVEIFCTHPNQLWGSPNLLDDGYRVSFPGVKRVGCGINHPPPSSAKIKERVELYLISASGPSWPVIE